MHLSLLLPIHISIFIWSAIVAAHPALDLSMKSRLGRRRTPPSTVSSNEINDCLDPSNTPRETRVQSCAPENILDAQGNCGPLVSYGDDGLQAAFCQVDVRWDYGQEVDLNLDCACSDDKCSITTTQSTQVTNTFAFDVGGSLKHRSPEPASGLQGLISSDLMSIFNAGATWSYSTSFTKSTAASSTKPTIASGKCSYWTFVPFFNLWNIVLANNHRYIDRSRTHISQPDNSNIGREFDWRLVPNDTVHRRPWITYLRNGIRSHHCYTDAVLPFCWQEPAYLSSGVSKDPSVFNDFLDVHENFDISTPVESTPLIECELGHPPFDPVDISPGYVAGLPSGGPLSPAYISS